MSPTSDALDLRDPARAGVYRVMPADIEPLRALADAENVAVHDIDLSQAPDKRDVLAEIARALAFPEPHWADNWDALADALNDLSWLGGEVPRLLVWHGLEALHHRDEDACTSLCEILEDASDAWREAGIAFWSLVTLEGSASQH